MVVETFKVPHLGLSPLSCSQPFYHSYVSLFAATDCKSEASSSWLIGTWVYEQKQKYLGILQCDIQQNNNSRFHHKACVFLSQGILNRFSILLNEYSNNHSISCCFNNKQLLTMFILSVAVCPQILYCALHVSLLHINSKNHNNSGSTWELFLILFLDILILFLFSVQLKFICIFFCSTTLQCSQKAEFPTTKPGILQHSNYYQFKFSSERHVN